MLQGPAAKSDVARTLADLFERWTGNTAFTESTAEWSRPGLVVRVGPHVFLARVESDASPTTVEGALAQFRHSDAVRGIVPLVVVPYMTPAGAKRCEIEGVAWADLSGNAHIAAQTAEATLYIHVAGRPNVFETRGRPRNAFAPKSARLARVLLAEPDRARTQKEIAEVTGLNAGHVSRVVARLLAADLVVKEPDGRVVVPEPGRLLDAWADSEAFRHRVVRGHLPGRSGEERARRLADAVGQGEGAFTGLAAAWAYTQAAAFRSVDYYVLDPPLLELRDAGFREDTGAPNVRLLIPDDRGVLDGARAVRGLRCVAPAQAYVDLEHASERADEFQDALRPIALAPPAP